jgi:hypothetical protein
MRLRRDRRLCDTVGIFAIVLERSCRVNDDCWLKQRDLVEDVTFAINPHRRPAFAAAMGGGLFQRATGNQDFRVRLCREPLRQHPAEHTVPAEDENPSQ